MRYYGDSPPSSVNQWGFPILRIYEDYNLDDPDILVEAYYISKGAYILRQISEILEIVFESEYSFLYPDTYLRQLLIDVSEDINLEDEDYNEAQSLLSDLRNNNIDIQQYLPSTTFIIPEPDTPLEFITYSQMRQEQEDAQGAWQIGILGGDEIPFADYNDYRLDRIERRYEEMYQSPYGDLLGEIGPRRRIEDDGSEPPPGYIWVVDGDGNPFLFDTRFGRGAPQA